MFVGLPAETLSPAREDTLSELSEQDLAPHARRALEKAYEGRSRERASRNDIAAGFIAALVFLGSKSSFNETAYDKYEQERRRV